MQPGSHEPRVIVPIAIQIKWDEFPGHTTACGQWLPCGVAGTLPHHSKFSWAPRLENKSGGPEFRDVWLRPLEPETPGAEIWGSQGWGETACGGWDFWEAAPL